MKFHGKPFAFLSSFSTEAESLRDRAHNEYGDRLWVAEAQVPWLGKYINDDLVIIDRILEQIRDSQLVIFLLLGTRRGDHETGTLIEVFDQTTAVSHFEIELFMAGLLQKPILVFAEKGFDPGPRLAHVLQMVQQALPGFRWQDELDQDTILRRIGEALDAHHQHGVLRAPRGRGTASTMHSSWYRDRAQPHVRPRGERRVYLLDGRYESREREPNLDAVDDLLTLESQEIHSDARMGRLWLAARELMVLPIDQAPLELLERWHRVLKQWCNNAGWYGLHGLSLLGFSAAAYTLALVRESTLKITDDPSEFDAGMYPAVNVPSALFSTAKAMPTRAEKHEVLKDGLVHLNRQEKALGEINAGLGCMYGSYYLQLGRYREAISMFKHAVEYDEVHGDNPGVSLSELGFAYLVTGRPFKALPLLRAGEEALRDAGGDPGFHARALRKLELGCKATLRFDEARYANKRRQPLIKKHGFFDQKD